MSALKKNKKRKSRSGSEARQPELLGLAKPDRKRKFLPFGGSLIKGNPRLSRPLSSRNSMHLILKSSLAKGALAFSHPGRKKQLETLIVSQASKQGVRVYELSINSNHIHLLVQPLSSAAYVAFIKAISGLIARKIMRRERGKAAVNPPQKSSPDSKNEMKEELLASQQGSSETTKKIKFWDHRPFTRIVAWGRAFFEARFYVIQNHFEAVGYLDYRPRSQRVMRI